MNKRICYLRARRTPASAVLSAPRRHWFLAFAAISLRVLRCPLLAGWEARADVSFPSAACSSGCCCSSGRCVWLPCRSPQPTPPPSCCLITAVLQLRLGASPSIVLATPPPSSSAKGTLVGAGAALPAPAREWDQFQNGCVTWHPGAPSLWRLQLFCLPSSPRTELCSPLQTAAILLLRVLQVCRLSCTQKQIVEASLWCLPASRTAVFYWCTGADAQATFV